jgi:hypothetical protein
MRRLLFVLALSSCTNEAAPAKTPVRCPEGAEEQGDGSCVATVVECPAGAKWDGRACRAEVRCPGRTKWDGLGCAGPVECPDGTAPSDGVCVAPIGCPPNSAWNGAACIPIPPQQPQQPPFAGNPCGCPPGDLMCAMRCSQRLNER